MYFVLTIVPCHILSTAEHKNRQTITEQLQELQELLDYNSKQLQEFID